MTTCRGTACVRLRRVWRIVRPTLATLVIGCGSNGSNYSLPVGSDDGGGGVFAGDGGSLGPLDASIEQNHVAVKLVTVSCSANCANVEAVATGGNPPYTFAWSDGTTSASREVCPTSSTKYVLNVTDTAGTGEFPRPAQSVQVPLTANVLSCPDSGAAACDSLAASATATGANPSGAWSYGWSSSLGAPLTLYTAFYAGGVEDWQNGINTNPVALFNSTTTADVSADRLADGATSELLAIAPGQFAMGPGLNGEYAVARWTARAAGTYRIQGSFEGISTPQSASDVHIRHDSVDVASARLASGGGASSYPFALDLSVAGGDTVDFATSAPAGWVLAGPTSGYPYVAVDAEVCKE